MHYPASGYLFPDSEIRIGSANTEFDFRVAISQGHLYVTPILYMQDLSPNNLRLQTENSELTKKFLLYA
jgi:hypothetical protein